MSVQAYDRLAPHYRAYARTRATYIAAVDRFVAGHAARGGRMLDVGSGDGVRAVEIARAVDAQRLVLCEPSERMAELCRRHPVAAVWTAPAQCLPSTAERFEIVTCLWNVLGHLSGRAQRIEALAGMRRLLAPGGRIFCDVNNRHNARAYGTWRVAFRRLADAIAPDDRRGDAAFEWEIGEERIPVRGHLFTPAEMDALVAAAGLAVDMRVAIDYATGECSDSPWNGQLLYGLRAAGPDDEGMRR